MTASAEAAPLAVAPVAQNGQASRRVRRITGLSDLEAIEGEIELVRPGDGDVLAVPYRSLTQAELMAERAKIRWPEPPKKMVSGAKGTRPQIVEDREDPAYLAATQTAAEQLGYVLVARCLAGGGVAIAGETAEAQAATVRERLGSWAFGALVQALYGLHNVTDDAVRLAQKN